MTPAYPRVMVVTADRMGSLTGTGVTLSNLFGSWPSELLAELHFSENGAESERVGQSCRFPPSAVPLDHLARKIMRGQRPQFADGASTVAGVPLPANARRPARRHAAVRAALDASPVMHSKEVAAFVRTFQPDLVYSLLGSARVIGVATRLAREAGVPLIPHFMDDWPRTLYSSGELGGWAHRNMSRRLSRALRLAPFALCISPAMCAEYQRRYGLVCHPFVNPVELPEDAEPSEEAEDKRPELLYVGGLQLGRWETLLGLAGSLVASKSPAQLTVYAPAGHLRDRSVPEHLAGSLTLAGSLPAEQVARRLLQADVLVHVESLDSRESAFARYSLSTKIPQYLSVGRPVLAIGAPGLASLETVENSGGGVVVTTTSVAEQSQAVAALLSDVGRRREYGRAGRSYAAEHFAVSSVRERLRVVLASAVTN